tara:strand:- start:1208 stop:1525 length:318 start_codon:yes stop_codon:yes gene_type:complete
MTETPTLQQIVEEIDSYRAGAKRGMGFTANDMLDKHWLAIKEALLASEGQSLHIVFDGPPGPEAGRFVECELEDGRGVNAGKWQQREDGFWELVITRLPEPPEAE